MPTPSSPPRQEGSVIPGISRGEQGMLEKGPIRVDGSEVTIASDGQVLSDGQPAGRIRIVAFSDPATLRHEGGTLWSASGAPQPARDAGLRQGFLEGSNVNPVEEMIDMMSAFRSYEANIKS